MTTTTLLLLLLPAIVSVALIALPPLSHRVLPPVTPHLVGLLVLGCALVMAVAERVAYAFTLYDLGERLCPQQMHVTARALGQTCLPCMDAMPGWWDTDVDCAGHACRRCTACREHSRRPSRLTFGSLTQGDAR